MQRLCAVSAALASDIPLEPEDRRRCDTELAAAIVELRSLLTGMVDESSPVARRNLNDVIREQLVGISQGEPIDSDLKASISLEPRVTGLVEDFIRESLHNALKHAGPGRVTVTSRMLGDCVLVQVSNPRTVGAAERPSGTRLGLRLLIADARRVGATVSSRSTGQRWELRLIVPLRGATRARASTQWLVASPELLDGIKRLATPLARERLRRPSKPIAVPTDRA
jgi:signal transduction histidine kinase